MSVKSVCGIVVPLSEHDFHTTAFRLQNRCSMSRSQHHRCHNLLHGSARFHAASTITYTVTAEKGKDSTCAIQSHHVVRISNSSAVNQTQAEAAQPQKLCQYVIWLTD